MRYLFAVVNFDCFFIGFLLFIFNILCPIFIVFVVQIKINIIRFGLMLRVARSFIQLFFLKALFEFAIACFLDHWGLLAALCLVIIGIAYLFNWWSFRVHTILRYSFSFLLATLQLDYFTIQRFFRCCVIALLFGLIGLFFKLIVLSGGNSNECFQTAFLISTQATSFWQFILLFAILSWFCCLSTRLRFDLIWSRIPIIIFRI